jgi:hypothetical protein
LSRDRFKLISSYLHFCDDEAPRRQADRLFKIRLLISTLNKTFTEAFVLGGACSFDEGTWATKSKFCPAKQFNPMKPHKWGLKLFMLCCSQSGFCSRFEVYEGKDQERKAGSEALFRNVEHLKGSKRVIYCDR